MGYRKEYTVHAKSESCFGRISGAPLTEYNSREEALAGADYARANFNTPELSPYRCRVCGKWHLSPESRRTPSTNCPHCLGANGKPKALYDSIKTAQRRADILREEEGVSLKVYSCPYSGGWHLTKQNF